MRHAKALGTLFIVVDAVNETPRRGEIAAFLIRLASHIKLVGPPFSFGRSICTRLACSGLIPRFVIGVADRVPVVSKGTVKWVREGGNSTVRRTQFSQARVDVWTLSQESFDSGRAFAARCAGDIDRLDVVVLSAAFATGEWAITADVSTGMGFSLDPFPLRNST